MAGLVRDLSHGGLSVETPLAAEQGDTLEIVIGSGGAGAAVAIETIVWTARIVRDRRSGKTLRVLGLVLSSATDDYLDLLESIRPALIATPANPKRESGLQAQTTAQPAAPRDLAMPAPPKPKCFRVQVQKPGSPRTRSVVVFADSPDEARERVVDEMESGWTVLDARLA